MEQAPRAPDRAQIVVRNSFIEVEEEDDAPPDRTQSDQTGLRSKQVLQLGRLHSRIQPITEERASVAAEEEKPEEDGDEEEDDDDESDMPLTRTQSMAYPAYGGGYPGPGMATADLKEAAQLLQRYAAGQNDASAGGAGENAGYPDLMAASMLNPWGFMPPPYPMFDGFGMYPPYPCGCGGLVQPPTAGASSSSGAAGTGEGGGAAAASSKKAGGGGGKEGEPREQDAAEASWAAAASGSSGTLPALGAGPPLGMLHAFHPETREMGFVSPDFRQFSKVGYEGRLSVVSEREVHTDGVQRYLVQFTAGELSRADGVGFVFSPRLPCAKNIQRIVSIFVNQRGRICMRVFADIVRASAYVKPLELGDWVEMAIDLEERVATFNIWPRTETGWPELTGRPSSTAVFPYGQRLGKLNSQEAGKDGKKGKTAQQANHKAVKLNVGHLACVVKNVGVTVTLAS